MMVHRGRAQKPAPHPEGSVSALLRQTDQGRPPAPPKSGKRLSQNSPLTGTSGKQPSAKRHVGHTDNGMVAVRPPRAPTESDGGLPFGSRRDMLNPPVVLAPGGYAVHPKRSPFGKDEDFQPQHSNAKVASESAPFGVEADERYAFCPCPGAPRGVTAPLAQDAGSQAGPRQEKAPAQIHPGYIELGPGIGHREVMPGSNDALAAGGTVYIILKLTLHWQPHSKVPPTTPSIRLTSSQRGAMARRRKAAGQPEEPVPGAPAALNGSMTVRLHDRP